MTRFITGRIVLCYSVLRLSTTQEKILKHLFECGVVTPEGVSHISRSIGLLQPSVHRSVSSLIKSGYVVKENTRTRKKGKMSFEKALYITDKGAAAAVVLGITLDQLENYYKKFASKNKSIADAVTIFERFKALYKVPPKREFLVKKVMEYLLNNNSYDNFGRVIYPTGFEFKKALRYIQDRFNEAFGNAYTVREFLDKYGINKSFLKEAFHKDRNRVDSILSQLESEIANSPSKSLAIL